uniref:Uncharacterized protein n=1 Tax=Fagus sylvatica TaxID=28930 RepID=A0A2N9ECL0_FAGSY
MVYGKFFRKPFSKTRPPSSTQSLLSLFLTVLSSLHCPEPPSHPQHPEPPRFLSRPARSQPTPSHLAFSLTDLSARTEATVAPKPQQRPAEHPSHRSLSNGLDLI